MFSWNSFAWFWCIKSRKIISYSKFFIIMIMILNHIPFMHRAYMDFQTIHALLSCMGGLRMCRIFTAGGGDWIKIVSDQIVERNVRSVGSRGLLSAQGFLVSLVGSRDRAPGSSWVFRVLRHQNASLHIIFLIFKFCCKISWHVVDI